MKRLIPLLLLCVLKASAQTATVTWTTTFQVVDGFGVSNYTNQGNTNVMNSYDNTLFNTIGISLLRVGVTSANGACTTVNATCGQGSGSDPGSSNIVDAQYCVNSSFDHLCRVWATPWSPPASYSSNGNTNCQESDGTNDNSYLATADYAAYATWLSNFVTSYNTYNGVQLYAISVQNEPDQCKQYPSNLFGSGGTASGSASAFDSFIKTNLGPTMHSANPNTLIMMPEPSGNDILTSYAGTCMSDSSCSQYIGVAATHAYDWPGHGGTSNPYSSVTSHYWESEYSENTTPFDGSMTDAIAVAKMIDTEIATNGFSSYHWYWGVCPTYSSGPSNTNSCLISASGSVAQRAYVMGQYAKFVRPGMVRIGTTRSGLASGITVSAYKNTSTGAFAIVATNSSSGSVSQAFSFSGITVNSITTTVQTDVSESMATISNPTVSGSAFTATLPANSVTTFVGTAASSGTDTYYSLNGGTFSGGSVCNGKATTSLTSTGGVITVSAGNTSVLCGVINIGVSTSGSGASGNVANVLFDTGARVSVPFCNSVCFSWGASNYLKISGGLNCGPNTACQTTEQTNPTGYPSGLAGIVEATEAGSQLANQPTTGDLFRGSGSNVEICCIIARNLYQHTLYSDSIGGGGAFVAVGDSGGNGISVHDADIHDADTVLNNIEGPGCSTYYLYNTYWNNVNWGFHGGTQPGVTCTDWEIYNNHIGNVIAWDQAANNAHGNPLGFLSRGGVDQGLGSYNGVYIYNNLLDGLVSQTTNGSCAPGAAGNHKTSILYFSGGPIVNAYIYNNILNIGASPCGVDDAMMTLNGETGSSIWEFNNTLIDSATIASGEGCNSPGAGTFVNIGNLEKNCNNFLLIQGAVTFPGLFDYDVYGERGTGGTGLWQSIWGNATTLSAWTGILEANGCTASSNGCETHSTYCPTAGCLMLNSSAAPTSGSPALSIDEPNVCGIYSCTGNLLALAKSSTAGNTVTPVTRPSSNWTAGALLSGSGTPNLTATPNPVAFGSVNVGFTSAAQTVTVTNNGTASGQLGTPYSSLSNTDYAVGSGTCSNGLTLAIGASCTAPVTVTPSVNGTDNGTLTINGGTGTGSTSTSLTATGVGGVSVLAPTSLTFGSQVIGTTSAAQTFTLTNNGPGLLTITSITKSGDFNQTNTCILGSAMAVSASCTFTVTFTPTLSGTRTGSVVIVDNGSNSPETEALSGTGVGSNPSTAFWNGHIRYEGTVTW